jgi:hypothetical protein
MRAPVAVGYLALVWLNAAMYHRPAAGRCITRAPDASTFEFASNPWLNLYNFLFESAKHARGIHDESLGARGYVAGDTAAVRPLSAAERREWNAAVEFFAENVVTDGMGIDSLVVNVNNVLAGSAPNDDLAPRPLHPEIRRSLEAVMPLYRSAWWPAHDRRNREWITDMQARLAGGESCLRRRAAVVFRAPWPAERLHVDATVYANWFGAYSTRPPTRITVTANARGSQGSYGLEVLLHEAAHGMLAPLDSALAAEAARRGRPVPPELGHLVLFYTAGALMREQDASYVSFADEFGIWRRNGATRRYHDAIAREWQPYIAGSRPFAEAVARLMDAAE